MKTTLASLLAALAALLSAYSAAHPAAPVSPAPQVATTTAATPAKTASSKSAPFPQVPVTKATFASSTDIIPQPGETPALAQAGAVLRNATVNLYCAAPSPAQHGAMGSGVVIDPRGIILTDSHVAQYFLMQQPHGPFPCTVRTGSPAKDTYTASVIYVSPQWVTQNVKNVSQAEPLGTGQYDYALLAITGSVTGSALPSTFTYVPLPAVDPNPGQRVVIYSYASEFLSNAQKTDALFQTLAYTSVKGIRTFRTTTPDVVLAEGGAAAQRGSSGAGASTEQGQIAFLITTVSGDTNLNARELQGLTPSYIRRDFRDETGQDLDFYLQDSVSAMVLRFASEASTLATQLEQANQIQIYASNK